MSNNNKAPTVKHTPLKKAEKFWETTPQKTLPSSDDETVEGLLSSILERLDTIIEKLEK